MTRIALRIGAFVLLLAGCATTNLELTPLPDGIISIKYAGGKDSHWSIGSASYTPKEGWELKNVEASGDASSPIRAQAVHTEIVAETVAAALGRYFDAQQTPPPVQPGTIPIADEPGRMDRAIELLEKILERQDGPTPTG